MNYLLTAATPADAPRIATLAMEAMNHECCQWFAGPHHTLDDFHRLLTHLICRTDSQYSHTNAIVCRKATAERDNLVGIAISYDGAMLHTLRQAFILEAKQAFGRDFSNMPDETQAGELYLDTLCVDEHHRGQSIARQLLAATIDKGRQMGLPTGLLVDEGNPRAEHLYLSSGFTHAGTNTWGGHTMHHLICPLQNL